MRPDEWWAGARAAHDRLLASLNGFSDDAAREPSLLPDWTRGHVLTHLARNADSNTHIFRAAQRGEIAPQYPGGAEQRAHDIEAGAGRPVVELVQDVATACATLESAWADTTDEVWATGKGGSIQRGPHSLPEWVFRRWREVEIHHVDLALGYGFDDWPPAYVREELRRGAMAYRATQPMGAGEFPPPVLALPPPQRLAWLTGRSQPAGLPEPPAWI
jgi:maleylpyruvate isomerase